MSADVTLTDAERAALSTVLPENEWDYDPDRFQVEVEAVVERIIAARVQSAKAKELREFADTRGVNVGDEDDEWWRGYRQAQRECLHAAADLADRIDPRPTPPISEADRWDELRHSRGE